jgi:hypothetical protein
MGDPDPPTGEQVALSVYAAGQQAVNGTGFNVLLPDFPPICYTPAGLRGKE